MSFFDPVPVYITPLTRRWRTTGPIPTLSPHVCRSSLLAPPLLTSLFMQLSSMIMDEVMLPVPELQPAMPYYDVLWNHEDKDGNVAHTRVD